MKQLMLELSGSIAKGDFVVGILLLIFAQLMVAAPMIAIIIPYTMLLLPIVIILWGCNLIIDWGYDLKIDKAVEIKYSDSWLAILAMSIVLFIELSISLILSNVIITGYIIMLLSPIIAVLCIITLRVLIMTYVNSEKKLELERNKDPGIELMKLPSTNTVTNKPPSEQDGVINGKLDENKDKVRLLEKGFSR